MSENDLEIEIGEGSTSYIIRERKTPLSCKSPKPILRMSSRARFKSHALCKIVIRTMGKYEAFAFCVGEEMGRVDDIIIPKQNVTPASVHVLPEHVKECADKIREVNKEREKKNSEILEDNKKIKEENENLGKKNIEIRLKNEEILKKNGKRKDSGQEEMKLEPELKPVPEKELLKPLYIVGWTHSHVDFSVFSSGTDDREHETLHDQLIFTQLSNNIPDDEKVPLPFYIVGITVNESGNEYPVVYASLPCGYRLQYEAKSVQVTEMQGIPLLDEEMTTIARDIYKEVGEKITTMYQREREPERFSKTARPQSSEKIVPRIRTTSSTLNDFLKDIPEHGKETLSMDESTIDDVIDEFSSKETWKIINKNIDLVSILSKIQKLLIPSALKDRKGDFSELYDEIKKSVLEMMHKEHELLSDSLYKILDDIKKDEEDEEDNESEEKCSICGDPLDPDNYEKKIVTHGKPVCDNCYEDTISEGSTDEVAKIFDEENECKWPQEYFDEDHTPKKCRNCESPIDEFTFSRIVDGFPKCKTCDEDEPSK